MPLIPYESPLNAYSDFPLAQPYGMGMSTRGLLTALGDYWTDYFADAELLKAFLCGSTSLISQQYTRALDMVLSSSLLNIPIERPVAYRMMVFDSRKATEVRDEAGQILYLAYPLAEYRGIEHLVSSLFEPAVALSQGEHYELSGGELRFFVDIFADPAIVEGAYATSSGEARYVLFWATNLLMQESRIYERFGTFLYQPANDSAGYRSILEALQLFYTNTKSVENLERILNVLYGLPYSRFPGEKVLEISQASPEADHLIRTTRTRYSAPFYCEILVEPEQSLGAYQLLARWHRVDDYITDPTWYDGARAPYELIESASHPDIQAAAQRWLCSTDAAPQEPKYSGILTYDGSEDYGNGYIEVQATYDSQVAAAHAATGDFLRTVKARRSGDPVAQYLYGLYDKVLKYNLVYLKTRLTYDNFRHIGSQTQELYSLVRQGFPAYLHALIETEFSAVHIDQVPDATDRTATRAGLSVQDSLPPVEEDCVQRASFQIADSYRTQVFDHSAILRYSGEVSYSGGESNVLDSLELVFRDAAGNVIELGEEIFAD